MGLEPFTVIFKFINSDCLDLIISILPNYLPIPFDSLNIVLWHIGRANSKYLISDKGDSSQRSNTN